MQCHGFNVLAKQVLHSDFRVLFSTGKTGAAAPVNLGQWVHAPVNFQDRFYVHTILSDFSS